ncbi:MAG: serine/threonine-protein kinase [Desulfomonilaceae bacterium]
MNSSSKGQLPAMIKQTIFKPTMFGRYCLIDQISKGGMSDIYLAKTVGFGGFQKPLVIKKLLPEYSEKPRHVKRFINEAKTLARLNHGNIVQILDMGVIAGEYYIALEYIEGRNVAHVISKAARSQTRPPLEFTLHVIAELAKGLSYAHKKQGADGENLMLVHQDVNSFNVMVSYEAEVKIIDFGIARIFLDKTRQDKFPVAGKLLYFSPEQLQKKPLDHRVDIYGTGVLFYELLTGKRLVDHRPTVEETVKMILKIDIKDKVRGDNGIPDELKPILVKAMAFDPEARYPWMEEMIEDIRSVAKRMSLDFSPASLSAYMKEHFRQEIALDKRRMRKLVSEGLPPVEKNKGTSTGTGTDLLEAILNPILGSLTDQEEGWEVQTQFIPKTLSLKAGKTIFRQGDTGSDIFVIKKGKVRLFVKVGSTRQTVSLIGRGDFFGESSLLEGQGRSVTARTEENCQLVPIGKEAFLRLAGSDPARTVIKRLVERVRDSNSLLESAMLQDTLSRLIYALLFFQRRAPGQNGKAINLRELTELFRLENSLEMQKYLAKLQALNVLQADEKVVQVKNPRRLENILNILVGRGKFTLKL